MEPDLIGLQFSLGRLFRSASLLVDLHCTSTGVRALAEEDNLDGDIIPKMRK